MLKPVTDLSKIVVRFRLPTVHLVEFDHDAGLPVVHPELLGLAALDVSVVGHPLYRSHRASKVREQE